MKVKEILLDVDGVLADFFNAAILAHIDAVHKLPQGTVYERGNWDMAKSLRISDKEFWARIDNYNFWSNVPVYEGAKEFVRALRRKASVNFCTISSENPECARAKIEWLRKHFDADLPVYICHGGGKALFAREDRLLIDDHVTNIMAYVQNRGPAIFVPRPWSSPNPALDYFMVDYAAILAGVDIALQERA
jgi:5'(3')-deoxyribonucleotidase